MILSKKKKKSGFLVLEDRKKYLIVTSGGLIRSQSDEFKGEDYQNSSIWYTE